tara:strand:- start:56 stop:265 length:210 start_codon:yes stop_codon:yes gene_type:complete
MFTQNLEYDWVTATQDKPEATVKLYIPNGPMLLSEDDAYKIIIAYNNALKMDQALKLVEALQEYDRSLN